METSNKDKYYEDDDSDYTYEDYDNATAADEEDNKFIESGDDGIVFDHVEFVLLRLKHISKRTSSNITEILALQQEEFKVNKAYEEGWNAAVAYFNDSKRAKIYNGTSRHSIVRKVPVEYHIALISYTLGEPAMYAEFNKDTREICSGNHIDNFKWKSYFKLLQLAVETLGSQEARWMDNRRFLYRGASKKFAVKEGQVLAFQHFISTSSALTSAENFAGASLFEFQGLYNGTAMAIWDHSYYEHEEEVLFSPLQVFQVDSIHIGNHYTRYVLVKHEMEKPCNDLPKSRGVYNDEDENEADRLEDINALRAKSGGSSIRENSVMFVAFLVAIAAVSTKLI